VADNKNVAMMFVGGALVIAVAATWGVMELLDTYKEEQEADARTEVEMVTVVAASRALYQGVTITSDDLFVVKIPPEHLPVVEDEEAKEQKKAEVFTARERVVGRIPRERILANELIRPERLANGNKAVGLNAVIPAGMRAISLDLRDADAVAGFLEPGNYVDIVVTMTDEGGTMYTETIMQTVLVLGVDSRAENESNADAARRGKQRPSVTFLVTQTQAEELSFANSLGRISLSLRNVLDSAYTQLDGVELDELLNRIKPLAEEPVVRIRQTIAKAPTGPSGPTVDIIRGTTTESVTIPTVKNPTEPEVHH
jgi:pilus assembly protein CpaB